MKPLAGFPPQTIVLFTAVAVGYFIFCWAPVVWPILATHRKRSIFPRRWTFVAAVASLAYGSIVAFLVLVTLPITAYGVFIAPQLNALGFRLTDPLLNANWYVANYWWLLLPPVLLLNTFLIVRLLLPIWPTICLSLTANNSFKPKPLRGSA